MLMRRANDATGLVFLRARYYSGQGRFIQHDTWTSGYINLAEPGVSYGGSGTGQVSTGDWYVDYSRPQSLNGWAYSLSNPVNHIDPSGRCPMPPASKQPAICLALFIKPDAVPAGLWLLHGDGRDFSSNSDPGASRGYLWLSVVDGKKDPHMNLTGYIYDYMGEYWTGPLPYVKWFEPSSQDKWTVLPGSDGEYAVTYDLVLAGYLENIAPHINGTIRFRPDGKGGYGAIGVRDGFPWAEAYYWDGQGNVQTIFQRPALHNDSGDAENLNAIENPVPWCSLANLAYHLRDLTLNVGLNQLLLDRIPQKDVFATP